MIISDVQVVDCFIVMDVIYPSLPKKKVNLIKRIIMAAFSNWMLSEVTLKAFWYLNELPFLSDLLNDENSFCT